jgi:hypothetical protein
MFLRRSTALGRFQLGFWGIYLLCLGIKQSWVFWLRNMSSRHSLGLARAVPDQGQSILGIVIRVPGRGLEPWEGWGAWGLGGEGGGTPFRTPLLPRGGMQI